MFELFNGVSDGELKGIYKDILKSEKDGLRPKSLDSYAKKLQKSANLKCFRNQSILRRSYFIKKSQRGISQNNEVSTSIYYAFRLIPYT